MERMDGDDAAYYIEANEPRTGRATNPKNQQTSARRGIIDGAREEVVGQAGEFMGIGQMLHLGLQRDLHRRLIQLLLGMERWSTMLLLAFPCKKGWFAPLALARPPWPARLGPAESTGGSDWPPGPPVACSGAK